MITACLLHSRLDTLDPLPASWHRRVAERHGEQARPVRRDADDEGYAAVAFC
jgi:hypothetical protein